MEFACDASINDVWQNHEWWWWGAPQFKCTREYSAIKFGDQSTFTWWNAKNGWVRDYKIHHFWTALQPFLTCCSQYPSLMKWKPTCQNPFESDKTNGGHFFFRKEVAASTQNQCTPLPEWWPLHYPKSTYPFARVVATPLPKINLPLCKSGGHSSIQNQHTPLKEWWPLLYPKSTYSFARVAATPLPKINIPLWKNGGCSST